MITGAHSIIYSTDAEADRAFLRDVLKLTNVDVGHGWLIFGLPPAEVAVHPSEKNDVHEFYLMCDDVGEFIEEMKERKIVTGAVQDAGWGLLTHVMLPGGGKLLIYEPRHARPEAMSTGTAVAKKTGRRGTQRAATKTGQKAPTKKTKRR
jgi:hypothetical protein